MTDDKALAEAIAIVEGAIADRLWGDTHINLTQMRTLIAAARVQQNAMHGALPVQAATSRNADERATHYDSCTDTVWQRRVGGAETSPVTTAQQQSMAAMPPTDSQQVVSVPSGSQDTGGSAATPDAERKVMPREPQVERLIHAARSLGGGCDSFPECRCGLCRVALALEKL